MSLTLLELIEQVMKEKAGRVVFAEVIHADDCIARDGCPCSCEPDHKVQRMN